MRAGSIFFVPHLPLIRTVRNEFPRLMELEPEMKKVNTKKNNNKLVRRVDLIIFLASWRTVWGGNFSGE